MTSISVKDTICYVPVPVGETVFPLWLPLKDANIYGIYLSPKCIDLLRLGHLKGDGSYKAWVDPFKLARALNLESTYSMIQDFYQMANGERKFFTAARPEEDEMFQVRPKEFPESPWNNGFFYSKDKPLDLSQPFYITAGFAKAIMHVVLNGGVRAVSLFEQAIQWNVVYIYNYEDERLNIKFAWEMNIGSVTSTM